MFCLVIRFGQTWRRKRVSLADFAGVGEGNVSGLQIGPDLEKETCLIGRFGKAWRRKRVLCLVLLSNLARLGEENVSHWQI